MNRESREQEERSGEEGGEIAAVRFFGGGGEMDEGATRRTERRFPHRRGRNVANGMIIIITGTSTLR